MEAEKAIQTLQANYPKTCRMVDGKRKGGFDDLESDLGQAFTTAIAALEKIQKISTVIEQLEGYKCEPEDYFDAVRNVHYEDAIILLKELLD